MTRHGRWLTKWPFTLRALLHICMYTRVHCNRTHGNDDDHNRVVFSDSQCCATRNCSTTHRICFATEPIAWEYRPT